MENDEPLKCLKSTVKEFRNDIRKQSGLVKCAKVTFSKGSQVKSKRITLNIKTEFPELNCFETYSNLGINKPIGIHNIKNE